MKNRLVFIIFSVVLIILLPGIVFTIVAFGSGLSPTESVVALFEQYQSPKQNLLVCGLLGLFPVLLVLLFLWLHGRFSKNQALQPKLYLGGLLPSLLVLLWANFEYWPDFLPARIYPGFPHGLELVLGPLVFAPIGVAFGFATVLLINRYQS